MTLPYVVVQLIRVDHISAAACSKLFEDFRPRASVPIVGYKYTLHILFICRFRTTDKHTGVVHWGLHTDCDGLSNTPRKPIYHPSPECPQRATPFASAKHCRGVLLVDSACGRYNLRGTAFLVCIIPDVAAHHIRPYATQAPGLCAKIHYRLTHCALTEHMRSLNRSVQGVCRHTCERPLDHPPTQR